MKTQLARFQSLLKDHHVDYYLVPSEDPHQSEYVDDHFKARQFLSGFTGSAGVLLVSQNSAWLWTDGRYFTQAEQQLPSSIELMRQGSDGVPTVLEFLESHLEKDNTLGVNSLFINAKYGKTLDKMLKKKQCILRADLSLVEDLWTDCPSMTKQPIYPHDLEFCGTSMEDKLSNLRHIMKDNDADAFFLSSLPDIAWLLNLRGDDMMCTPLFYSYLWITNTGGTLFARKDCISADVFHKLQQQNILVENYYDIESFLKKQSVKVMLDLNYVNYFHYQLLFKCKLICGDNPTELAKAIKNETEIANLKQCHIKDGIAMTKFMYWLKTNVGKIPMDEISVSEKLSSFRETMEHYIGPSFDTICAYKDHAAMMHYQSSEDSNVELKPEGMLLIDSGGQYYDGTTDVTRTFILGPISEEEKRNFTLVCKSMLLLADAKFLSGCRGSNLDVIAREPLWEAGLDYRCGTGHGVGFFLGVHEGPQAFRFRSNPDNLDAILMPGMVITDEPGVYTPHKYGIRTENMLLCKKWKQNEYGSFLCFEPFTMVPIDMDGIDFSLLDQKEKRLLSTYQQLVYDTISPYLTDEECQWLKQTLC